MKYKSSIAGDIEAAREKANLDAACKRLLANKPILAWIMKSCLFEYADHTIKDIAEKYIEGTPEISSEPVHQDEVIPDKITGSDTGDVSINEGTVTYDIKFTAIIPNTKNKIHMYINIEAQNEYYPGYPLIKRGLYYCCRMISSQYNREFTGAHYEKLKKVCSIWICIDPPQKRSRGREIDREAKKLRFDEMYNAEFGRPRRYGRDIEAVRRAYVGENQRGAQESGIGAGL